MKKKIDWTTLPFKHSGRWKKDTKSIMNPLENVTWPQFVAEMVVFNRTRFVTDYPKIIKGPGWSNLIQKQVRGLAQQASILCNYFPHPSDEPLVTVAFKNYFRNTGSCKIGAVKRVRVTKDGRCTVGQDEKDAVKGVTAELSKLLTRRATFDEAKEIVHKDPSSVTYRRVTTKKNKGIKSLIDLEDELNEQ